MDVTCCYQDEYIAVFNKPNDILIHHSYMARNLIGEKTLLEILQDKYHHKYTPVHRLDRKTSGLIVMAKSTEYVKEFQSLFEFSNVKKIYLALVRGHIKSEGAISSPVKGKDSKAYKEACTYYTCIKHFTLNEPVAPYESSRYSLIQLNPSTGRMHQLRIHMNKISHPIVGDTKYGDRFHNRLFQRKFEISYLFLHAHQLKFYHPFLNKEICLEQTTPLFWEKVQSKLTQVDF